MNRRTIRTRDGKVYDFDPTHNETKVKESQLGNMLEVQYREEGWSGRLQRVYIEKQNIISDSEAETCCLAVLIYGTTLCGSMDNSKLQTLREVRDNVLRKNEVTEVLVNTYYSQSGKWALDLFRRYVPLSIPLTKRALDTTIEVYKRIT